MQILNRSLPEEKFRVYEQRLRALLEVLQPHWHWHSTQGATVLLTPRIRARRDGKLIPAYGCYSSGDVIWVATDQDWKRVPYQKYSIEHVLLHELGHRYEATHGICNRFQNACWHLVRLRPEEVFAELFARSALCLLPPSKEWRWNKHTRRIARAFNAYFTKHHANPEPKLSRWQQRIEQRCRPATISTQQRKAG